MSPVGVGVIGLGFMGRTHLAAYRAADEAGHPNRLVAVCDQDPDRLSGDSGRSPAGNFDPGNIGAERLFDPASVAGYERPEELLSDASVELVSICTHTDTHVELALAALEAGKHVLVEKPVATALSDVERLAEVARASDRLCMPAMCIRFWPAWSWARERVVDGSLGAVKSATFRRLGTRPGWSGFYADQERTGGALVDLHVHDTDFVRWCFGDPESVVSTGTLDHLTTLYRYPEGPPHVTAEGGWDHGDGFDFRMRYTVVFERATADYDMAREPQLVLARDGGVEPVELESINGYDGEVRHLLDAIAAGGGALRATIDDAVGHTRLLAAERTSLATGEPVQPGTGPEGG
ncbi:MAG: Gfo/Idh/MocA family oxidoreductase [Planctomycetota bacterium]|nr:Gfo/Idh/MocA family oxidoreductase [Planctomycetota bacterium]